jgi:ribosomal protein L11 methyltransferase
LSGSESHARIEVRVSGEDASERAEIIAAQAFEAGATGLEERNDAPEGRTPAVTLLIYAPAAVAPRVEAALRAVAAPGTSIASPTAELELDWVARARAAAKPVAVGDLVIRPSWSAAAPEAPAAPEGSAVSEAQAGPKLELVIDPGQAFGTGAHESTRLALRLLQRHRASLSRGALLDVGCGSGVLALAARLYGAAHVVAFDLDPLASAATRQSLRRNDIGGVRVFCGPLEALATRSWETIVANLLRSEHEPIFARLAAQLASEGSLFLSGLLEREAEPVLSWAADADLEVFDRVLETDASGVGWLGLALRRSAGSRRA